ncbi:MAG: TonB-dependent receptor [Balneolales bacterium]|nr:TonB-dependent receptor [Balneolales bacterium]
MNFKNDLQKYAAHFLRAFSALLLFCAITASVAMAETGTISGEVTDEQTGETLPGATLVLKELSRGITTDIDGRFLFRRIPAGDYTLEVRYIGYETTLIEVSVTAGSNLEKNIALAVSVLESDDVVLIGYQRGQSRALTRQRQSANIRTIISAEQIDRFADQTVSGALQRIPGMGHGGEANIRGVGQGMSRVTVDGQRMGSTGADRSVDLSTISADMVQELDVVKVITPDMSADALSGVINISTRRPIGGERSLNVRTGSGFYPRYLDEAGPGYRLSLSYGDSPSDTYSFGLNASYQREPTSEESVSFGWRTRNLGPEFGIVDLLDDLQSTYSFGTRDRYGMGGQLTFQPTPRSTYHVQGMFNLTQRRDESHSIAIDIASDDYLTPFQTGPTQSEGGGSIGHRNQFRDRDINQYTLQAGGRHLLDGFDLEYKLGWGYGRSNSDTYAMRWENGRPGIDFLVDIEDRWRPALQIASHSPRTAYPNNEQIARTSFLNHTIGRHIDNEITGSIDLEMPISYGKIKFGGSAMLAFQEGYEQYLDMAWDSREGPGSFAQLPNGSWNVFDREGIAYEIRYLIDSDRFIDSYQNRFPQLIKNVNRFGESESTFYSSNENVLAYYAMTQLNFGRFTVLGGARAEHTISSYEARESLFSDGGSFLGSRAINATNSYTNIFPNLQFIYRFTDFTNLRLAYSRSIGRPTFNQLSPYREFNYNSREIRYGNPDLKPMVSDNLDLMIEHYFRSVGQISVGVFYKKLDNFVFSRRSRIGEGGFNEFEDLPRGDTPDRFVGWHRTTFLNGDDADVYGLELSWQQNLVFLPWYFQNLGVYFNYTYTFSEADIDRLDDSGETVLVRLQDQRPHVINAGLDYTQGRFSGQLTYQWSDPYVSSYANERDWVPTIQLNERVYPDLFTDGASDVSLTLRYRISPNFRIWADGSNLFNNRSVNYRFNQEFYPTQMSLRGREIAVGLNYSF